MVTPNLGSVHGGGPGGPGGFDVNLVVYPAVAGVLLAILAAVLVVLYRRRQSSRVPSVRPPAPLPSHVRNAGYTEAGEEGEGEYCYVQANECPKYDPPPPPGGGVKPATGGPGRLKQMTPLDFQAKRATTASDNLYIG